MHTTQKSHKELIKRDKPRHSNKDLCVTKKGGAGGKGTWGSEKDDVKFMDEDIHSVDRNDPNFDPTDLTEDANGYRLSVYTPTEETKRMFSNSMTDLTAFKAQVRDSLKEFLVSHDAKEFIVCIKDARFSLFHQDLPAILVKYSVDKPEKERTKIAQLLHTLSKENVVTSTQMTQGFRKLFHAIDDLEVDAPNAKLILSEFVGHGLAAGYLDGKETASMEKEALDLADFPALKGTKAKIASAVKEYLASNELKEFGQKVSQINPAMQYEVIKKLISLAMDLEDSNREQANKALAELKGSVIHEAQVIKGITILLNRVEDLYLDVPNVLELFACIIARAVVDEVLPPSFLLRVDLSEGDMGFQVALHAKSLTEQEQAAAKLEQVWTRR